MRTLKDIEKLLEGAEIIVNKKETIAEMFGEVTECRYCGNRMLNGTCGTCGAVDCTPKILVLTDKGRDPKTAEELWPLPGDWIEEG